MAKTEKRFCPNCGTVDANVRREYGCLFWFVHVALTIGSLGLWLLASPLWFLMAEKLHLCPRCGLDIKEKSQWG